MKMKSLILLLIALGLFLFIYFYERKLPTTEEAKEREKKVFNLKEEEINYLFLKSEDLSWELKKERGEWKLKKPLEYPADEFNVSSLLRSIVELEKEKELKEVNLKDFRLEEPNKFLDFSTDKLKERIIIGVEVPGISQVAIRLEKGGKSYFVPSSFLNSINKSIKDLRSKEIFKYDSGSVNLIEIEKYGKKINVEKKGKFWYLDFPIKDRAEKENIEDLIYGLSSLRAKEFLDEYDEEKLKEINLLPPFLKISFYDGEKKLILQGEFGFKKGLEKNDFYVKNGKRVFLASHSLWEKLEKGILLIPDTKVFSFSPWEVMSFKMKTGEREYNFEKKEGKWFLNGKDLKDENPVINILKELSEMKWMHSINKINNFENLAEALIRGENFVLNSFFYKTKDETFWVKVSDRPNYWSFVTMGWQRIEKELDKLKGL